jgi:hypothetical protein
LQHVLRLISSSSSSPILWRDHALICHVFVWEPSGDELMMQLMLLRFPHRQIDATLDQEDTQIYAKTRSDIQVGSVMEDPSSRADARSDKVFHLPIHAIGGAHLYFVRKVELIMSELHARARPDSMPQGRVATPFWASSSGFLRTAEEICSDELSLNHGAGSITQFELCVNRLVSCDRAECQHDLVQLIVRF